MREFGQFDAALTHFRRGVELDPQSASARSNLGQMLVDSGLADRARHRIAEEAVRLQPDLAPLQHNLGNALRALDKLDLCPCRLCWKRLRLDSEPSARPTRIWGLVLQQQGQLNDAARASSSKATELKPDDATFWEYLAELYGDREEPAEAIPCWKRVLALAPDYASAHNGMGWALQDDGRAAEAGEHYRAALRFKPDFAAARMALGGLHEELGELTEAEAAFREALRLQPTFALPHARLATLLRGRLPDADSAAMDERLADPNLDPGPSPACYSRASPRVVDARVETTRGPPPVYARGQRPEFGTAARAMPLCTGGARTRRRQRGACFWTGILRSDKRLRASDEPSGVHLRPAALGDHARRANPREPSATA